MVLLKKYRRHLYLLAFMLLAFIVQVKAQFDDDGGPGDFDPPPENDVPLDTYQWVFMGLALAYGVYIYMKHRNKVQPTAIKKKSRLSLTALNKAIVNQLNNML